MNAANLMLARGSQRQRELAIRLAIGAARGRIVRQLLTESAVLALVASAIAVLAAWAALRAADAPIGMPVPIDATVLALAIMAAVATTLAFGLAPALRLSVQRSGHALAPAAARGDAAPGQSRVRRGLVVAQVALSLALLALGSQLVATVRAMAVSAGTPADRLVLARFDLAPLRRPASEVEAFYERLRADVARLGGVEAVGLARPTAVWSFGEGTDAASLTVWHAADGPADGRQVAGGVAGGDLFAAVGLRFIAGRGFTAADRRGPPQVAVLNETAARAVGAAAVGSLLRVAPQDGDAAAAIEVRVVGVVEAAREPRLHQGTPPAARIYLPSPIEPEPALALYVRTSGPAAAIVPALREGVARLDPRVPLAEIGTLAELNERAHVTQLWLANAAAVLGAIGLVLAATGVYGMASYFAAMRARELAIRIALGAAPRAILALVLAQSLRMALAGLVVGGVAAVAVSRWIQAGYYGVVGIDVVTLGGAIGLFIAVMLLAGLVPAARAAAVDPLDTLKDA